MSLDQLEELQSARIQGYETGMPPDFRSRLQDLGFCIGEPVTCLKRVPFGGPNVYRIAGAVFSLDRGLARQVILA